MPQRPVRRHIATAMLPIMLLCGCDALPDSGPVEARILNDAKKPETNPIGFQIVPIAPQVINVLDSETPPSLSTLDTGTDLPSRNNLIGRGDVLAISVLEIGSGLFGGGSAGGGGGPNPLLGGTGSPSTSVSTEALPPIEVDGRGEINMPYVGPLRAAGRTPEQLAAEIEGGLKGKSQQPQVLVRVVTDLANSVIVSGEVRHPGRQPLTMAGERLLDIVAIAGGASAQPEDSVVLLRRGDQTGEVPLRTLEQDPAQNIPLRPGDRIQVSYLPRTYTVFGATGKVSETPFNSPELTLAEALARIGGPLDERADPNAVFLFRFESSGTARDLGLPPHRGFTAPVIYQLDMLNPTSYFLAQKFTMRDRDLIYIANAKTNKLYKFLNLISQIVGPGLTASAASGGL